MANATLFRTKGAGVTPTNTTNKAGGRAYEFSPEHTLAQGIVTSCFNRTFYTSEAEQLDTILGLAQEARPEFVAKAAVYGHEVARMKDGPALMAAVLMARGERALLAKVFPRVITRFKMMQNFVQMVRSGKVGKRSFGTSTKRLIQGWFQSRTGNQIFTGSIGANPSMADVLKMVHPAPESAEKRALYGYLIGREHIFDDLPPLVRQYEQFKKTLTSGGFIGSVDGANAEVPSVPFQMLASLPLQPKHWRQVILNMPWNALRMNLNTAERHGVLSDLSAVEAIAAKLGDPDQVRRNNAFPYQLLTTFQNVSDAVPMPILLALQDAMETATENVPVLDGGVAVCVDVSGSMRCPVTGFRLGSTTKTRCVDVAALVAASLARKNRDTVILPFDHRVHATHGINPRDSVMTNAQKLAAFGGGATDCAAALRLLNTLVQNRPKTVIFVSDNESWYNDGGSQGVYWRGTGTAHEWDQYRRRVPGARMVCIDIQANRTTMIADSGDVMNVGGFSDKVWPLIERFARGADTDFVRHIEETISLDERTTSSVDTPEADPDAAEPTE